jgi:hypothetical protein
VACKSLEDGHISQSAATTSIFSEVFQQKFPRCYCYVAGRFIAIGKARECHIAVDDRCRFNVKFLEIIILNKLCSLDVGSVVPLQSMLSYFHLEIDTAEVNVKVCSQPSYPSFSIPWMIFGGQPFQNTASFVNNAPRL